MKRSTAALLTGALAASGSIALATLSPSIASADSCGPTPVTQLDTNGWAIPYNPDNSAGATTTAGSNAAITSATDDLVLSIKPGGRAIARYDISVAGVPLAEQTSQSQYALTGPGVAATGFSYQLVLDLNRPESDTLAGANGEQLNDFAQLVYEPGARQGWYSTRALTTGQGANQQENTRTLDEISVAYPDARIVAFLVQVGKLGDAGVEMSSQISSVTFGCNVFEFDYVNTAPAATFTAGGEHLTVTVDGSDSTDLEGDARTYSFDFGDNTPVVTSSTPTASHTYASAGSYTITLTVTDEDGLTSTVSKSLNLARATNTGTDKNLAATGADVKGLAALGALVVGGSAAGLVANRRRKVADAA
jgi:PKD repeat protein